MRAFSLDIVMRQSVYEVLAELAYDVSYLSVPLSYLYVGMKVIGDSA